MLDAGGGKGVAAMGVAAMVMGTLNPHGTVAVQICRSTMRITVTLPPK